jgi:hypothetical protein
LKLRGCTLLRPQPERAAEKENEREPSLIFVSLPFRADMQRRRVSQTAVQPKINHKIAIFCEEPKNCLYDCEFAQTKKQSS